jgi:hypothetical protein
LGRGAIAPGVFVDIGHLWGGGVESMYWSDALSSAIEVAVAIAGFSGIVAAVGRRGAGEWTPADQLRLRMLLTASGVAGAFAFLPFILLDTGLDPSLVWRAGSATQGVWLLGIPLYRRSQASRMNTTLAFPTVFLAVRLAAIGVLLLNTAYLAAAWPYVVGVIVQLSVAFMTFVQLLLDSWHSKA